ncbi:MAG: hypothetical protein WBR15_02735 [Gammaproteobacteria bacterium]
MSWSHSIKIVIEKDIEAIKADIEKLFNHSTVADKSPQATPAQTAAAATAAQALAASLTVPSGHVLVVAADGHAESDGSGSVGVSVRTLPATQAQ